RRIAADLHDVVEVGRIDGAYARTRARRLNETIGQSGFAKRAELQSEHPSAHCSLLLRAAAMSGLDRRRSAVAAHGSNAPPETAVCGSKITAQPAQARAGERPSDRNGELPQPVSVHTEKPPETRRVRTGPSVIGGPIRFDLVVTDHKLV